MTKKTIQCCFFDNKKCNNKCMAFDLLENDDGSKQPICYRLQAATVQGWGLQEMAESLEHLAMATAVGPGAVGECNCPDCTAKREATEAAKPNEEARSYG